MYKIILSLMVVFATQVSFSSVHESKVSIDEFQAIINSDAVKSIAKQLYAITAVIRGEDGLFDLVTDKCTFDLKVIYDDASSSDDVKSIKEVIVRGNSCT